MSAVQQLRLHRRSSGQVVIGICQRLLFVILQHAHPAGGVVAVGEAVGGFAVIPDSGQTAEAVIRVMHGTDRVAGIAEHHVADPPDKHVICAFRLHLLCIGQHGGSLRLFTQEWKRGEGSVRFQMVG